MMPVPPRPAAATGPPEPTVASVAVGEGRPAVARSFRFHRPRGPFCGLGYCQQCPVRTDAGSALACETPAGAGRSAPRLDPLRPIGRRGERLPPWFYEHRFGWPAALRQTYLRVLRHLSSAAPLPPDGIALRPGRRADGDLETAVLVIGGGPTGLTAARAAADHGHRVVVVERTAARPSVAGLDIVRATCVGIYGEEAIAAIVGDDGPAVVRFERLIVATGAYDRPLAYLGNDLPGTIGVRAFERYAAAGSFRAGARVGVFAARSEAERTLTAARRAGIEPVFVAGPEEPPSGASSPGPGRLERAVGRTRVRAVRFDDGETRACDVLVLGFSQPSFELQAQAGAPLATAGVPEVVVVAGQARVPIVAVGGAAGDVDVEDAGERAAVAVDGWLRGSSVPSPAARVLPDPAVRHPDAFVCPCEDVRVRDLEAAIADGFGSAELIKRRTGAGTGPCQGKLCLGEIAAVLRAAGVAPTLPTIRTPARPVSLAAIAGSADA